MESQVPNTLSDFFVWLASGPGIAVLILWLNSLPIWLAQPADSKIVAFLKASKREFLVLTAFGAGALATAATTYIPPGVIETLQPYYKILWLAVFTVTGLAAGQLVIFTAKNVKARMDLRLEERRAYLQANRLFIEQHGLRG